MKKIAFWAKANPWKARFLIAFGRISLAFWGFTVGIYAAVQGLEFHHPAFAVSGLLFIAAYLAYPQNSDAGVDRRSKFGWRKACYAVLVASSLVFWLAAGNYALGFSEEDDSFAISQVVIAQENFAVAHAEIASETPVTPQKMSFFKKLKLWKQVKKSFREYAEVVRSPEDGLLKGWVVLLLFLLNIILVVGLGYIVFALSCSLSCSGQEGAAAVVLILGILGIIGLSIAMWRGAKRAARRKRKKAKTPEEGDWGTPHQITK